MYKRQRWPMPSISGISLACTPWDLLLFWHCLLYTSGQYGKKPVIGFASEGSEHGEDNIKRAMELAAYKGLDARLIEGEDIHKEMEKLLDSGEIDAAVTMHYPFPIGVSTVGKVITPGIGKPMYLSLIHI